MHVSGSRPYLWMLAGSFSFSVMAALAHEAKDHCPWQVVAFFRAFLVFVMVGVVAVGSGVKLVFWRPGVLWMRSIAGSFSLVMTFFALTRHDVRISTVLTLTNTFPVWVAVLSWPMLGSVPALRVWLAVVSGIVGVFLIEQPEGEGPQLALGAALGASLATSIAMLGLHRLKGVHSSAVVVHFALVASVFAAATFVLFPYNAGDWRSWSGPAIPLLLGIGLSASIGQMFLTKAFATGDPSKVSVVALSQVLFALLFDLGQDHRFGWETFAGMFLIVAPTAWVMRRSAE